MAWYDIIGRLMVATVAGFSLGFDREMRGKPAGLRTHGLVALSSAIITVSALSFYFGDGPQSDPLRVVQGLAQAIGFIVAGSIFVSRGNVRNLTSAAIYGWQRPWGSLQARDNISSYLLASGSDLSFSWQQKRLNGISFERCRPTTTRQKGKVNEWPVDAPAEDVDIASMPSR